jgi:hypothetical protein
MSCRPGPWIETVNHNRSLFSDTEQGRAQFERYKMDVAVNNELRYMFWDNRQEKTGLMESVDPFEYLDEEDLVPVNNQPEPQPQPQPQAMEVELTPALINYPGIYGPGRRTVRKPVWAKDYEMQ